MSDWNRETILNRYQQAANCGKPYTWFNYQPINLPGYEATLSLCGRDCFDRSAAVASHLRMTYGDRPLRIVDWGCNLGFFCFELAQLGHHVTGIDNNPENVELCRYLARTSRLPTTPQFFCDSLSVESLPNYRNYDVAVCFSVLHHLGKDRTRVLKEFAETYPHAYIEMDGTGYGYNLLFSFYWQLDEIAETNDRYGSGHRTRKTWHCSNRFDGAEYRNIKQHNLIGSRGVFRVDRGKAATVVKREMNAGRTHTWIDTDLMHEREMYHRLDGVRFFPKLLNHGEERGFRWVEMEYVENDQAFSENELYQFYDYLVNNQLFILDLTTDSFLFTQSGLKVIDLESIFPLDRTPEDLVRTRTRRSSLPFGSYEEQLSYLLQRLRR